MFGFGASVETDAGSSGYLAEDRQETFELGRLRDCDAVDKSRNEKICVLQSVADGIEPFTSLAEALVEIVRDAVDVSGDSLAVGSVANEFIIHVIYVFYRHSQSRRVLRQRWQFRRMRQGGFRGSVPEGR